MKKLFVSLIILLLCVTLTFPALASDSAPRLVDNAGYLSDGEASALSDRLDSISKRYDLDVVIVTVPDLGGKSAMAYADDYYDENGYSPDGILLLVSRSERKWWISTAGYGISVFTDAGLEYMEDRFVGYLSDDEYGKAFNTFADLCSDFLQQAESGRPYDVGHLPRAPFDPVKRLAISLGIGFIAALIATLVMKSKLKSVHAQPAASQYVKDGSLQITESREIFLYRHVDRQAKANNNGGSGTHVSSSGRVHGGRGGSF